MAIRHRITPPASIHFLIVIAIALAVTGCDANRSRLVGNWTSVAFPDRLLTGDASPMDVTKGQSSAEGREFSIRLQFYRSGRLDTVTYLPNIQSQKSGTWRLISFDAPTQTAIVECELMQQRTRHEIEFQGDDTIRLIPPNMAGLTLKLVFKRN